jgi:hypothetical protein|tara:strand:+ start:3279 stop:3983 length:705 start_codon:yes stop_codon:yes gene_type:complete
LSRHRYVITYSLLVVIALLSQWLFYQQFSESSADYQPLPPPPSASHLQLLSLGDPIPLAQFLNLWLQSHDRQPGLNVSYRQLDYPRLIRWLEQLIRLHPESRYPLLAAAKLYGNVGDPERQRLMFDFVYHQFLDHPEERWQWLAHVAILAKHDLNDLPLALKYSQALTEHANARHIPYWVRDMQIIILKDMGKHESAALLIGALLANDELNDPKEIRFLTEELENLAIGTTTEE